MIPTITLIFPVTVMTVDLEPEEFVLKRQVEQREELRSQAAFPPLMGTGVQEAVVSNFSPMDATDGERLTDGTPKNATLDGRAEDSAV